MSSERIRKKWPSSRSCYDEGRGIYSTTKDSRICTIIKTIWKPHSSKNHLEKSYLILSFYLSLHFARKNSHRFLYLEYVLCNIRFDHYLMRYIEKIRMIHLYIRLVRIITPMNIYFHRHQRALITWIIRNKTWIFLFVNFTQNGFFCLYSWSNCFSRFSIAVRTIVGGQLSYYAGQQLKLKPIWKNVAK